MVLSRNRVAYTLSIFQIIRSSNAALSLAELQPITGFPSDCQAAYDTPIPVCPSAATFVDAGSTIGCDRTCFVALNDASIAIQTACRSTAAYGDTVISHAFKGDLSVFLCGNQFGDGSNSATATNVGATAGIPITKSRTATASMPPSTTASETSSTDSASTSSQTESSTSTETTDSSSSTTSIVPSTTMTTIATSSASSRTTSAPSASSTPFDSTPFDQGAPDSRATVGYESSTASLLAVVSSISILGMTWLFGS